MSDESETKLRTIADARRIFSAMVVLLKDNRPLTPFGSMSSASMLAALFLGISGVVDYSQTGLVERLPTAVLATGLLVVGLVQLAVGLILDLVDRSRVEAKRLACIQAR